MKSGGHNTKFLVHSITSHVLPPARLKEAASKTTHEKSSKTSTQDGIQASGESAAAAAIHHGHSHSLIDLVLMSNPSFRPGHLTSTQL